MFYSTQGKDQLFASEGFLSAISTVDQSSYPKMTILNVHWNAEDLPWLLQIDHPPPSQAGYPVNGSNAGCLRMIKPCSLMPSLDSLQLTCKEERE